MKRKVLVVGNGANAYALAKKFSKECDVFVAPSSDAIKDFATGIDIREDNVKELLEYVMENDINMTVAFSVKAISADIATIFAANRQQIFAPAKKAAEIISDKSKAKKLLYKLHVQTPKFGIFDKQNMALDYIKNQKIPFVIKTNEQNSAVILTSAQTAKTIADSIFVDKNNKIIIEDYIYGTSFSFYAVTDGYKALPIGSSLTYNYSLEGNGGQLTSGMGACVPNYKLSTDQEYEIMDNIIYPTIEYLESENSPYVGILGVNGIISDDGKIYTLGWHLFTQDSDTAPILEILGENLYDLFESCIVGSFSDEVTYIKQNDAYSVSLVLKNINTKNTQNTITGLDLLQEDTIVTFYPNVRKNRYIEYEAFNGNVLSLTSTAMTINRALEKVYEEAREIQFDGIYYRKDICNVSKIKDFSQFS